MKILKIVAMLSLVFSVSAFAFTKTGDCISGKFVKACAGDNIYVLENRQDYDLDEEDGLNFVRVNQMNVVDVKNESQIVLRARLGFGGPKTFAPETLIVRQGCVFRKRYCIEEQVFIPGYVVFPTGKIVGIFMDGRVLVERVGEKAIMNTRDLVRLRQDTD